MATDSTTLTPPLLDPQAPLLFIVNAGSGEHGPGEVQAAIRRALDEAGRSGELRVTPAADLAAAARRAAQEALQRRSAVVSVGGDGTTNAVAGAAHETGCVMGLVAQGTFNYVARTHGLPTEAYEATQCLLQSQPRAVQVATVNDRLFLVNASLGLYPDMLQDREAFKQRFGRNRAVAFASCVLSLLRRRGQLHLRIEGPAGTRKVVTPTLFVGNNRLQLEQVGLAVAPLIDRGRIAAVMAKPIGSLQMLWLLLRGSMGHLGDENTVESFGFLRLRVRVGRGGWSEGRKVKVACDGELMRLQTPLVFAVAPKPLYLLKPPSPLDAGGHRRTGIE